MPTRLSGQFAGALALWGLITLTMWLLPWPGRGRPVWRRVVRASFAATVLVVLLGTVGGVYLDSTMPGRTKVYGALSAGVAAAVWIALSVRAVLRALSVASVADRWDEPAPHDDRALWVVVPAYQEVAGITATLDALAAQQDTGFELVVVDNASTDGTADVVRRWAAGAPFPVHVLDESERGTGCAVDTGIRFAIAHGAGLLARTDADALPVPDWTARVRSRFAKGAEVICGASVPRRDEDPSFAERHVLPAVQRLLAVYGRFRGEHRGPAYLAPYVLCHGHDFAITADVYVRCGGALRVPLEAEDEDVALLNRARQHTAAVVRAEEVVVENSLRRLRAWGVRRTLYWYWDRRWTPDTVEEVHVR
jgi:GT2 family glycosyltransferase